MDSQLFASRHVVIIPHPSRSHINAMLNFSKLLASSNGGLHLTFVVTEEWLGLIGSPAAPRNIRLRSIPNVIPSEFVRGADMPGFFAAVQSKMEGPFEELVDQLELPVGFIVADTFLSWAPEFGNRRNIPVASFWPMAASTFSVRWNFDLLISNGHLSIDISDILVIFHGNLDLRNRIHGAVSLAAKANCLLVASFHEVETHAIELLKAKLPLPVYSLGPCIPYMTAENRAMGPHDADYFNWLDSQPKSSVLLCVFWQLCNRAQMDEIATGLRASGARFLWIARNDVTRLQHLSGEMGLVVPWCDQLKVLCHSSVGGFLTHCGWNSTMECVFAGKIMLSFPLSAEQFINTKLIVEDWKVGMKLKNHEKIVEREEIARNVQRFMDLENDEGKQLRKRARELQEACKRAIEKAGSSYTNLHTFVGDVLRGCSS
ncbi:LOW QUALITY PROTEIN: UDP-glycosyltransferase 87A1 [Cinnamomum micranthum f. kanehirae]|uniref:UDP-glycosyltransferase 87A1 n=1 Tax=Cinnamomum micranthum f. kanehirae TaxID=337451 RepID=A0A443NBZ9_9MAGN|nr:LOW QUALITY PROTEIN: UDP-glycosyltransferase 87A1 [Cinnamomum micranthum f. kanehirae]